jgi:hypothetical protein
VSLVRFSVLRSVECGVFAIVADSAMFDVMWNYVEHSELSVEILLTEKTQLSFFAAVQSSLLAPAAGRVALANEFQCINAKGALADPRGNSPSECFYSLALGADSTVTESLRNFQRAELQGAHNSPPFLFDDSTHISDFPSCLPVRFSFQSPAADVGFRWS